MHPMGPCEPYRSHMHHTGPYGSCVHHMGGSTIWELHLLHGVHMGAANVWEQWAPYGSQM
jgi:hypothetical protein